MYRQLSSSRTGSALLCRASSHKRYNSDFQLMTKKAKFRKIRFKPFSKDGNHNPWFDTVQSRSGTIFTQCIQQFPSSETLRPIQNAYSQQSMSSTSTKNRTCWVFVFWSFKSRKAQPVLVSLYLKQLYFSFLKRRTPMQKPLFSYSSTSMQHQHLGTLTPEQLNSQGNK